MGRDKATLEWQGLPLAVRVAGVLAAAGCEPVVQVGGSPATGLSVVADRFPGEGPLGGVLTALGASQHPLVAVVACDLPRLGAGTIIRLVDTLREQPDAGVVLADSGRPEPLCAVWRVAAALPVMVDRWGGGERSLVGLLADLVAVTVPVAPGEVLNANTPVDLEQAGNVSPMVEEISVQQLSERLGDGITLIDVREPDEYSAGHAPGAVLIPLGALLAGEASVEGPGPVYMICRSGARSRRACEVLALQGLTALNVAGGTMAWIASGFDTVEGMDPT